MSEWLQYVSFERKGGNLRDYRDTVISLFEGRDS